LSAIKEVKEGSTHGFRDRFYLTSTLAVRPLVAGYEWLVALQQILS
jgi:hypothetical protein